MNLKVITKYKMALIQNQLFKDKYSILENVSAKIKEAVTEGCKVCVLGEFFNSIFQDKHLELHAEDFNNEKQRPTFDLLRELSKQFDILIIGGLAERGETKLFNAAVAFNNGQQIASYRKNHLFNVDIPGGIKHTESDQFGAGDHYSIFETQYGKFGLGICYDIRFPAFSYAMREEGCDVLVFPSAFNQTTGPRHWELLVRSRALDQQVYVAGSSAARYLENDVEGSYQTWGHSTLADPMGQVVVTCGEEPALLIADIDLDYIKRCRNNIPTSVQRRNDLYEVIKKGI